MTPSPPKKRHHSLRPLSREHHDGLLLCWKIRRGLQKNVASTRMADYVRYFYRHHLAPHFQAEEQLVFPVLGKKHLLVARALDEHDRLRSLMALTQPNATALDLIGRLLEKHIRFEERELFELIQNHATPGELRSIESAHHSSGIEESWDDRFWQ